MIIFLLFSAEDLQKLTYEELQELRDVIENALATDPTNPSDNLESLKLKLRPKIRFDENFLLELNLRQDEQVWVERFNELLLKRFYEVSHQLNTPPVNSPQLSFDFEMLIRERNAPVIQARDKLLLEWAISCELNHIEFYYPLLKARQAAYTFFEEVMSAKMPKAAGTPGEEGEEAPKFREKEPDSLFSPFNPLNPLYSLFYGSQNIEQRIGPDTLYSPFNPLNPLYLEGIENIGQRIGERVQKQITDLLISPPLNNYRGFVYVKITNEMGEPLPMSTERLPSPRAEQQCHLVVWFQSEQSENELDTEPREFVEPIDIRSGNDAEEVTFEVALDSDTLKFTPEYQSVTLRPSDVSSSLHFPFSAPEQYGQHNVWAQIFQKNRLIQAVWAAIQVRQ